MIRCITIDDEPLALQQMESYIEKTPFLELRTSFSNALDALNYLADHEVDLLFVDINMPELSGMEMVKSMENGPLVIFTTAYSDYAVEGFKVNALDYLLKPISYADFLQSARKAEKRMKERRAASTKLSSDKDFLFIKSDYKVHRINLQEILYIEGMREYVKIHLENRKALMPLISIKKLESKLPSSTFMRVHRSYIVNLKKVATIEKNRIYFSDKPIPVSDQYKEKFQKYIDDNFLI
jgi:DNA-binding LytR/AlgR family response regulator